MARAKRQGAGASERQQFWLDHQQAQVGSGQSTKAYAVAHGLSLSGFYAARKRLRAQGLLAPSGRTANRRGSAKTRSLSFARVAVARKPEWNFRLELPSGALLAWSGDEVPRSVVELLERMHDTA